MNLNHVDPDDDNDEDCEPTTGPQTCPIDLESDDATLPNQSSMTCDGTNPKQDRMQKMIDDRIGGGKFDPMGGMVTKAKPGEGVPQ